MNLRQYSWVNTNEELPEEIQLIENHTGRIRIFKLDLLNGRYSYSMNEEFDWQFSSDSERQSQCFELLVELNINSEQGWNFNIDFETNSTITISIDNYYAMKLTSLSWSAIHDESSQVTRFEEASALIESTQQMPVNIPNPFSDFLQQSYIDSLINKVNEKVPDQKLLLITVGDKKLRFKHDEKRKLYRRIDESPSDAYEYRRELKYAFYNQYGAYFKVGVEETITEITCECALKLQKAYPNDIEFKAESVSEPIALTTTIHKPFLVVRNKDQILVFKYSESDGVYKNDARLRGEGEVIRKTLNHLFPSDAFIGLYFKAGRTAYETTITLRTASSLCKSNSSVMEFTDDPKNSHSSLHAHSSTNEEQQNQEIQNTKRRRY